MTTQQSLIKITKDLASGNYTVPIDAENEFTIKIEKNPTINKLIEKLSESEINKCLQIAKKECEKTFQIQLIGPIHMSCVIEIYYSTIYKIDLNNDNIYDYLCIDMVQLSFEPTEKLETGIPNKRLANKLFSSEIDCISVCDDFVMEVISQTDEFKEFIKEIISNSKFVRKCINKIGVDPLNFANYFLGLKQNG